MANRDTLGHLSDRLRERKEDFSSNFSQWKADVREDPSLLWRTPAIRWSLIVLLAIGAVVTSIYVTQSLTPAAGEGWEAATRTATIYVACTDPACRRSHAAQVPMSFRDWPMKCDFCGGERVYRATLCPRCRGWFATAPGESTECPLCAAAAPTAETPTAATRPVDPDEDW